METLEISHDQITILRDSEILNETKAQCVEEFGTFNIILSLEVSSISLITIPLEEPHK